MFNPSIEDVRIFFYNTYTKGKNKEPLTDMEKIAFRVILEHPEYHNILANKNKCLDYQCNVDSGVTNPFLHMSLHITIYEQLSIDQPFGINKLYKEIYEKNGDLHETEHTMIDCLGEMIWHAQKNQQTPDVNMYFNCLKAKIHDISI